MALPTKLDNNVDCKNIISERKELNVYVILHNDVVCNSFNHKQKQQFFYRSGMNTINEE